MNKIFKYPLALKPGLQEFTAPSGELLTVQMQDGVPKIWIYHNDQQLDRVVKIYVMLTGEDLAADLDTIHIVHLATLQHEGEVYHFFRHL